MTPDPIQPDPRDTLAPARPDDRGHGASLLLPFDPAVFRRQLALADAYRRLAVGVTMAAFVLVLVVPLWFPGAVQVPWPALVAIVLVPVVWVPFSVVTTRVARSLPLVGMYTAAEPEQAERLLAEQLARRPVMRWARLLTYHRLAALRHRQRRYGEAASICQHVLREPTTGGGAAPLRAARPHLLLMLAEAQLCQNNLPGAYEALRDLHQTRLGLGDATQRLALQTRYALKAGHFDHALDHGRAKVQLAELMPPPQCAAMHAMLATAAQKAGRAALAAWLWERTELLAPASIMDQLRRGAFDVEVVVGDHEPGDNKPV